MRIILPHQRSQLHPQEGFSITWINSCASIALNMPVKPVGWIYATDRLPDPAEVSEPGNIALLYALDWDIIAAKVASMGDWTASISALFAFRTPHWPRAQLSSQAFKLTEIMQAVFAGYCCTGYGYAQYHQQEECKNTGLCKTHKHCCGVDRNGSAISGPMFSQPNHKSCQSWKAAPEAS